MWVLRIVHFLFLVLILLKESNIAVPQKKICAICGNGIDGKANDKMAIAKRMVSINFGRKRSVFQFSVTFLF